MVVKLVKKVIRSFDLNKNYKLFRKMQNIVNYPYKKGYSDYLINLEERDINIRCFNVNDDTKDKGIVIFFHGGGWISGSVESYTNILTTLSESINRIIIAVDYRLAPEYKFPCGFNDCYDITKLIAKKVGYKRIVLMGDSAGGNLAATVSQKLKDELEFRIRKQILIYPALSCDYKKTSSYKSVTSEENEYFRKHGEVMINNYINNEDDLNNPYVAPMKSRRIFFAPRTLIITCGNDPLKDEGYEYHKKLKRRFNNSKYVHYEKAYHGFLNNPLEKKHTNMLINEINEFLN